MLKFLRSVQKWTFVMADVGGGLACSKSSQYRKAIANAMIDLPSKGGPMHTRRKQIILAALALLVSAPVFAAQSQANEARFRSAPNEMPGVVHSHHDRDGAYYGKHKLGRDPDPNVRESIINSHRFEKGAY